LLSTTTCTISTLHQVSVYALSGFWILIGLFGLASFSLIPQVALFESNHPLLSTPLRSYQLLKRRGRLFVMALQAGLAVSIALSLGVASLLHGVIGSGSNIVFYVLTTLMLIGSHLLLTALYRKRKLARY
jgi:hypothetical protein